MIKKQYHILEMKTKTNKKNVCNFQKAKLNKKKRNQKS